MAKLISKTYGDALFEAALEKECLDEVFEEAKAVYDAFLENPQFSELMVHPKILKEEKVKIVEEVFKNRVSNEMAGFINVIVKKDRFGEMKEILSYFISKVKEYKGVGVAYVTTPTALKQEQKDAVEKRLLETTSYKTMEINYSVDESLIGGMIVRINDRVVDSSISSKMEELKRQLLKVQLG